MLRVGDQTVHFKSSEDMSEVPDESVTLVVTSPPYWNAKNYRAGEGEIGYGQGYEDYVASLNRVWEECARVLQPNGKIAINLQPLPVSGDVTGIGRRSIKNIMFDAEAFFRSAGFFLYGMTIWDKSRYVNSVAWGSYPKPSNIATNTSYEQIYVFVKPGATRDLPQGEAMESSKLTKHEWRHWAVDPIWQDVSPVIKVNSSGENTLGHAAPFPEDIPYRMIKMHTCVGETVLDPFAGSGTTLKMCRLTGRAGIGYELNQDFEPMIRERILSEWEPPPIHPMYFPTNNASVAEMILAATGRGGENPVKRLYAATLEMKRSGVITPAQCDRIREAAKLSLARDG